MTGTAPSSRSAWIAIACAATAGFALRFLYLRQLGTLPFFDHPVGDSAVYLRRAAEIGSGALLPGRPFFYGSILYPYGIALLRAAAPGGVFTLCLSQIVAGAVLIVLVGAVARTLYGPGASIAAATLTAFYGPLAFLEADVLGLVWGLLALMAGVLLCVRWALARAERSWGPLFLAGLCLGLAATERPNLLVLGPVAAGWAASRAGVAWRRPALGLLAGWVIPLALVIGLARAGTGQWVPLTTSGGINLAIGYHAGATGTFEEPWEKEDPQFSAEHTDLEEASVLMASRKSGRPLGPQPASRYWAGEAIDYVRSHPLLAARMTLRKAALLLNQAEVPNHLDYAFLRGRAPALRWMPVGFAVVLALAVLGTGLALAGGGQRPGTGLLVLLAGGVMLGVLPFFVADRYRAAMVPLLLPLAGFGAAGSLRLLLRPKTRRGGRTALALVAAAVALLVSLIPLTRPRMGRDYWMLAQAYEADGRMLGAIVAYQSAVEAEPGDAALLNNLGVALRRLGRLTPAATSFRRAIAADSALAFPHRNLGMTLIEMGDLPGALDELRRAARLVPGDVEVLGGIGGILAEQGRTAEASRAFAEALRLAPRDPRLLDLIRHYPAAAPLR